MNVPKRKRSVIAFTDALCRLVSDTPIKKITVTGICDEAGYTSLAFYSSFENKYDFVNSIIDHEAQIFACCVYNRLEQADRPYAEGEAREDLHCQYMKEYYELKGKDVYLVGAYENKKIVAAALIYHESSFRKHKKFAIYKGFIMDYTNKELSLNKKF